MARYRSKISWKGILAAVLSVLVVTGAIVGIVKLTGKDTRSIGGGVFSVGGIDAATGKATTSTVSIYTKDKIACQGLVIEPEFDSTCTYQVFFYNEDDKLVGNTAVRDDKFLTSELPACAQFARFVIYPSTLGEDGKPIEDFKVSFFDVREIANNLTITVNKEQPAPNVVANVLKLDYSDAIVYPPVSSILIEGAIYDAKTPGWGGIVAEKESNVLVLRVANLSVLKGTLSGESVEIYFLSPLGAVTGNELLEAGNADLIEIPEDTFYAVVTIPEAAELVLTEYMPR